MKLAMCDDDKKLLDKLKPFAYQYANSRHFEMVVDTYDSGEDLLGSGTIYDMIFLDYQMGGMDGMSTAQKLRARNLNSTIVFMTNYPDFVYESFEVSPLRFFKKPVKKADIYYALDAYFKMYDNDYPIRLRYEGTTIFINTQDIVYVEAMGRECIIHLPREYKIISDVIGSIIEMLPKSHFFRPHRGFCVNFNYIAKYDTCSIYMKNGAEVSISKRGGTPFRAAYKKYADRCNPKRRER